jgi:cysteinyl-tRNA synthetase
MSMSLLGDRFDIHTGGADNVFPHHEAEIAQSEGVTGHRVVSLWMHGGLLMLQGARMAKSAGNFFRILELEDRGFDPLAFRYLALQAKYRTKLNFTTELLAGADRALRHLRERIGDWSNDSRPVMGMEAEVARFEARFRAAIADDLDVPLAMALIADLSHSDLPASAKASLLRSWDRVLGLDLDRAQPPISLPDGASALLESRERARAAKDYVTSDRLRDELAALGVEVTDTAEGQKWKATRREPS